MHVTCPSCDARFAVKPEMFAAGPRSLRCARCGHRWRGKPEQAAAIPQDPPLAPEIAEEPEAHWEDEPPEPVAADASDFDDLVPAFPEDAGADRNVFESADHEPRSSKRRTPLWVWSGWLVLIMLLAATAFGLVFMREQLVRAWPPVERLYHLPKLLNAFESKPPVTVRIASSEREGTRMVLSIEAVNNESLHQSLPTALIELLDKDGTPVGQVRMNLAGKPLNPREIRTLPVVLTDIPDKVVLVRAKTAEQPQ